MNLNFLECYTILGIAEECDWPTFRKNYKSLIQQNHPDRFTENTPEHESSERAIRNYNAAYKIIFDYYQLNKSLPPRSEDSFNTEKPEHTKRKKRPPVSQPSIRKKVKPQSSFRKPVILASILSGILAILLFQVNSEDNKQAQPIEVMTNLTTNTQSTVVDDNVIKPKDNISEQYYSIGSSIGDVIIIEGKPTHIIDTTWYYGESSITFTNGVVASWNRHPDYPLKIRLTQHTPLDFNKPDKPTIPVTKKPYWKR